MEAYEEGKNITSLTCKKRYIVSMMLEMFFQLNSLLRPQIQNLK